MSAKKMLLAMVILTSLSGICFGTIARINSMGAGYYVPDNDYDALYINPVFILNEDKMGLSLGASVGLNDVKKEYKNTVTMSGTNINSSKIDNEYTTLISPSLFFNMPLSENMGFGINYRPYFYFDNYTINTASNAFDPVKEDINYAYSAVQCLPLEGVYAIKLGDIKLGIKAGYWIQDCNQSWETLTNSAPQTSVNGKEAVGDSSFYGKFGAGFNLLGFEAAPFIGGQYELRADKTSSVSNIFYKTSTENIINVTPGIFLQKKITDRGSIRLYLEGFYQKTSITTTYDKSGVDSTYGSGSYDNVYKYVNDFQAINGYALESKIGYFSGEAEKDLRFIGLSLDWSTLSGTHSMNSNTQVQPTAQNQKYRTLLNNYDIYGTLTTGVEGKILEIFIPRCSISVKLIDWQGVENKTIDSYDVASASIKETNTVWNQSFQYYIFQQATITGGIGIRPFQNLSIDLSTGVTLLSLNLNNQTSDRDMLQGVKPKTVTSGYNILLNASVSYRF